MKRLLSISALLIVLSIISFSCKEKEKAVSLDTSKEIIDNPTGSIEDNYKPGEEWQIVWSDEFKADSIDTNNWNFQVEEAGRFNNEWQRYTNDSKNAYIDKDCLVIKVILESDKHGMDQYTSARMHTANKQSWKYGKIVSRIKLPHGEGIWPAFWMLGANIDENGGDTPWPQSGEIDILELYGSKDDGVVESNIHYADKSNSHASVGASAYKLKQGKFADDFHIFELEWDENKISWLVDGEEFSSVPITSDELTEFHKEFFMLFNIAVGGKYSGRPNTTSKFPQHMYIDWVRVFQKK